MVTTNQIAADALRQTLLQCLEEAFERVHGIFLDRGTSLFETLDALTADRASRPIAPNKATVAAHVEHIRFYLDVLDQVMRTRQIVHQDWRDIWNRVSTVTPDEWTASRRRLRDSYQKIRQTIQSYTAWDAEFGLSSPIAVLAHTAYHLGAIRQAAGELTTR